MRQSSRLRLRGQSLASAALLTTLACAASPASAQLYGPILGTEFQPSSDRGRNTSVLERERPEYDAAGIRTGSFIVFPRIETGIGYSSNVYGQTDDAQDDAYFAIDPTVSVSSDWGRHSLSFGGGARLRRFTSETPKNENGYFGHADGRLDIDRATALESGVAFSKLYEPRSSGTFPVDALASVPFYRTFTYGRVTRQGGRIRGILGLDYTHVDFDNVRALDGGTLYQKDRDRTAVRGTARADYAVTPDVSVFGQVGYTDTNYERPLINGLPNRDGEELRLVGGASFDLTALIRGEIGVGYVRRSYKSPIYPDLGGVAAEARFEYFASQLTTISAAVRRYIEDSNIVGSGGYYANNFSLGVDHELLRNLLLNARAEYEIDDYQGIIEPNDVLSLNAGARYFVSRSVGLAFDLGYLKRSSDDQVLGINFDEFHGSISLILQR